MLHIELMATYRDEACDYLNVIIILIILIYWDQYKRPHIQLTILAWRNIL